jgi:KDO2-lipid IV(A) lauroyltransferase
LKDLFRVLALLPLPLLHALGTALGWVSFLASPGYRRRSRASMPGAGDG